MLHFLAVAVAHIITSVAAQDQDQDISAPVEQQPVDTDGSSSTSIDIRDEIPSYELFFESIRLDNLIYSVSKKCTRIFRKQSFSDYVLNLLSLLSFFWLRF